MRLGSAHRSPIEPGLAIPYPALVNAGLRLRRGQTSLTVAAPGVGKSQLWANLAQRIRVPTLYWSADTDQSDVTLRSLALWTNYTVNQIEEWMDDPHTRGLLFDQMGDRSDHIDWVFDSPITPKLLDERLKAFAELHGEWPWLTVVDNLSNAIRNPADEYAEIKEFLTEMQQLARKAKSHIAVLHHAKGIYEDGDKPIPQSGAAQNPFKIPEVGVTIHNPGGDKGRLGINLVKMRSGVSDPTARNPIILPADLSRASVNGYTAKE